MMSIEKKIAVLLGILIVGTMIQSVYAQFPLTEYTNIYCSTNTTLRIENLEERCIDNDCRNFTITKEEFCINGCTEENIQPMCVPSDVEISVWWITPIIVFFLVILILALRRLSK